MVRRIPFTKNREAIYDLLSRARRYHATVSSVVEIDVTDVLEALDAARAAGRKVTMMATLVRASALTLERFPRLNQHLFHGLVRKFAVQFDDIACNLIMLRDGPAGEQILLPLIVERANEKTIEEIAEILRYHQETPFEQLPQAGRIEQLKKLPRVALKAFSFFARSDPKIYRKFFGTYGMSPLLSENERGVRIGKLGVPTQTIMNVCTAFFPTAISEEPRVVDGEIVVRKVLSMMFAVDHYLIDGHEGLYAVSYLSRLLADPEKLGL